MVEPTPIPTAAAQESIDEGKQRRVAVPRRLLGELAPRMADYDPVATLERQ